MKPLLHRRSVLLLGLSWCAFPALTQAQEKFDHNHSSWTKLLKKNVRILRDGQASQVDYAGFVKDKVALNAYLKSLSAVTQVQFNQFTKAQQKAFLINAYNAFTVELILTEYPNLESIKELGTFFSSPWKEEWISLFAQTVSLDHIEHGLLRKPGIYDDPRVHFAVNCASIGCPMLREEAFIAKRIDQQLDEQAQRFMSDRSRNRLNEKEGYLELSSIFDWYADDFTKGYLGIQSVKGFAAQYADALTDSVKGQEGLRMQKFPVEFLDYDWKLNKVS